MFFLVLSERKKCTCDSEIGVNDTCSKALGWLRTKYSQNDLSYLKSVYEKLQQERIEPVHEAQIVKDVQRTCQSVEYFQQNNPGWDILVRVLRAIAAYDPQVGYVQGMNQIASVFVYHAEEYVAFWLLAMVFEMFEMRDIYLPSNRFFPPCRWRPHAAAAEENLRNDSARGDLSLIESMAVDPSFHSLRLKLAR